MFKKRKCFATLAMALICFLALLSAKAYAADDGSSLKDRLRAFFLEAIENDAGSVEVSEFNISESSSDRIVLFEVLDELKNYYEAFWCDYIGNSYMYDGAYDRYTYISVGANYDSEYKDLEYRAQVRAQIEEEVNNALAAISSDMSDLEKVLALYNYLQVNDKGINGNSRLTDKYGDVRGYSAAFWNLLPKVGVKFHDGRVCIDGDWYDIGDIVTTDTRDIKISNDTVDEGYVTHAGLLNDEAFEDYIFYNREARLNYYDSYWYFLSKAGYSEANEYITKAKVDGSDESRIDITGYASYLHIYGDKLYYNTSVSGEENTSTRIYSYDLNNGKETLCIDIADAYPGYYINEFTIKDGCLIFAMNNGELHKHRYVKVVIDDSAKEVVWADSLRLYRIGDSASLLLSGDADLSKLTFTSSDDSIVTVNDAGVITCVGEGAAYITVKDAAGKEVAVCEAAVDLSFCVKEIKISRERTEIHRIGSIYSHRITINPTIVRNDSIIWSSSNPEVATVDSIGDVRSTGYGVATITATCEDTGEQLTAQVVVAELKLNKYDVTLDEPGETFQLVATGAAVNETGVWSSSAPEIVSVDSEGNVKALRNGEATILYTVKPFEGEDITISRGCDVEVAIEGAVKRLWFDEDYTVYIKCPKGGTRKLNLKINPEDAINKEMVWTSSDESVATVDNEGVVTAVGNGYAYIYVNAVDKTNGDISAKCYISVQLNDVVWSVWVSPMNVDLYEGETTKLEVDVMPATAVNRAVKWSTSDEKVATVDSEGNVVAVGAGDAVITATAVDESNGIRSDSCNVHVEAVVKSEQLEISMPTGTFPVVGLERSIVCKVTPDNAVIDQLVWTSSDTSIVKVEAWDGQPESATLTTVGVGEATITAYDKRSGKKATYKVCVEADSVTTVYDGVDYSPVYDYACYTNIYADVITVFGENPKESIKHFVEWGMPEGRKGSEEFDIKIYKANYYALVETFGNDNVAYYHHYINSGKAEGRNASTLMKDEVTFSAVYEGVDYSDVYDYKYYTKNNPDVIRVFGEDPAIILSHFVTSGIREKRRGNEEFYWYYYMMNYSDLARAFGTDDPYPYYMHYINSGKKEGRTGAALLSNGGVTYDTKYNGVDYRDVYDYDDYMKYNEDLMDIFYDDKAGAIEHFATQGMSEGRRAKEDFAPKIYKFNYPGLQEAFGDNMVQYYIHYMNFGKDEGRNGATRDFSCYCVYEGVDYTPVYNYEDYIERNPDVYNAYGLDAWAVLKHFVEIGMSEGRQGSDDFNANVYRSNYPDLETAFGEDMAQYYHHYINSGYNEGRNGASTIYTSDTIHAGVDYADVYNYDYYVAANPDVAAAFGDNKLATLAHFVRNGMAEGRQGSAEFNVRVYMEKNPDLAEEFGDNLAAYYMHYIEEGKDAGREAQ